MTIMYSLLSALFTIFLYFNPASATSPYETAEYFASYDRVAESHENVELFESLGIGVSDETSVDMKREIHYAPLNTNWPTITIDDEFYDGYATIPFEETIEGELLHLEWDAPIPDVAGRVIVLPTTDVSYEAMEDAYEIDYYGEVLNDEAANRYLTKLAEANAAGYLITPHPDAPEEYGFAYVSAALRLNGAGVDRITAESFQDGQTVAIEPFTDEIPYVEFTQPGTTDKEVIVMARLEGSWYGDHALTGLGGASVLYHTLQAMDDVETDATVRYVFLNGTGDGYESSTHYLQMLQDRGTTPRVIMLLDILGTGETNRFFKTSGMTTYPFMEGIGFGPVEVKSLGVSILDEYKQAGFAVISVNDSVTAHNDVYTDKDTISRLSDEAMRDHVKWLSEWLTLQ